MGFPLGQVVWAGLGRLLRFQPWRDRVRELAGPAAKLSLLRGGRGVTDTYLVLDGSGETRGVLNLVNPWREWRLAQAVRQDRLYRYLPPSERFRREYQLLEVLHKEGLGPRPRAVGSTFLLRDFVPGRTLAHDLMKDASAAADRWWEAVHLLLRLHSLGLYHADPRPENILITPSGLQLIDFEHAFDEDSLTLLQCRAFDFLVLLIHTKRLAPQWLETEVMKDVSQLTKKLGPVIVETMATLIVSHHSSASPETMALVNAMQASSPTKFRRAEAGGFPANASERMTAPSAHFVRRLRARWLTHAAGFWWGDAVDSRFLLTWEASALRGCSVLDIGCNAGVILSEVHDTNLKVGIDINPEALEVARPLNPTASFFRGDMLRLPYRDAVFEVVIFAGMLEVPARPDKVRAIQEVHRVLKPGGRLLLTTPNRAYPRYRRHNGVVTYDELVSIVGPYFEMEAKGFNPFPPFPWFLPNRLLARIPGIWPLLTALMAWDGLTPRCCSFYVRATKKRLAQG